MKIQFLGAAGTVTGSRTLVTGDGARVLVDCGLFQGFKPLRERNWEPLPVEPSSLDAVLLTHAHIDHSGWIPRLVREGFRGPVYCTEATRSIAALLLVDSGHIHEEDAAYANRKGFSRHHPALPLYTQEEASRSLERFRDVPWNAELQLPGDLTARFRPAGHILGAATITVRSPETSVLFSGDLGRPDDLVMRPPASITPADHLVVESTYGDRLHPDTDPLEALAEVIVRTADRGGLVLVPSFAVGRSQILLRALQLLKRRKRIPDLPVFLDSPMAVACTDIYVRHHDEHRLTAEDATALWESVHLVRTPEESKQVSRRKAPAVVISAAGMLTGGRVLHHLKAFAPEPDNTLLFVGYQAGGTRGDQILAGAEAVKVHGQMVDVNCEVARIDAWSAHADREELLAWLGGLDTPPRRVWLNHGEPRAADALRKAIQDRFGWSVGVARDEQEVVLEPGTPRPPRDDEAALERRVERITGSAAWVLADRDADFLQRDDLRATRLMLEYLKAEKTLQEQRVDATIVVWGSNRLDDSEDPWYQEAQTFGRLAASEPLFDGERAVVFTGGGPGIMAAANRGAHEAGYPTGGLGITLPREQAPNPWLTPDLCFRFRYFAIRKMHFLRRARALVAFPGGFGTLDEVFDALTLLQTKRMPPLPVVLVGRDHWSRVLDLSWLVEQGLIDADDARLVHQVDSAEGAWEVIRRYYRDKGRTPAWGE